MVRAPRSHRGGRRFKSSIAHHFAGSGKPRWRNGRRAAFRAQCPYGCVGSNPSLGTKLAHIGPVGNHPPGPGSPGLDDWLHKYALVAQWIERCPAEAEVVGSSPAKRAITLPIILPVVPFPYPSFAPTCHPGSLFVIPPAGHPHSSFVIPAPNPSFPRRRESRSNTFSGMPNLSPLPWLVPLPSSRSPSKKSHAPVSRFVALKIVEAVCNTGASSFLHNHRVE